ncbi:phosphodiester glycosidase family protein [Aquihabitans sp. McL0605]|uniref:phosphodiester glycosidase family protein n=1 Tax=Aquihabitans sp. McL0605 TaxID=3415671 RepID=UPI003CF3A767
MTATLERPDELAGPEHPGPPARRRRSRRRRGAIAAVVILVPLVLAGWSFTRAMTYPGSESASVRSVDWLRSHGGAGIVDRVEIWHYSHQEPPTSGVPTGPLPPVPDAAQAARAATDTTGGNVPLVFPAVRPTLPGEAALTPGPVDAAGRTATYTTWFRPDPKHPTVVAGVLWMDRAATRLHLVAGTKEPGHGPWPGHAQIPPSQRSRTLAAFNAGFLMRDSGGGFYEAGHTSGKLTAGAASLVIDRNGVASLGAWGRDVRMAPDTVAVRQNLHLIVDGGHAVKGLTHNADRLWGSRRSQLQYTWRTGAGIDRNGNLFYLAGNHMTLAMLADALAEAGAVRAMPLDIHTPLATANIFKLGSDDPRTAPVKLLPAMYRPADRYQAPDQRDFFTVTMR